MVMVLGCCGVVLNNGNEVQALKVKKMKEKHTFIIAEMSGNHNCSFDKAMGLLHAAKDAGADAVKLQTYTADILTIDCDNSYFKINGGTAWDGRTLHELYQEASTPWEWHALLKEEVEAMGMTFFSTPFDTSAVAFLEDLDVELYKIASFELVDTELLRCVAQTGKSVIMSTGMATLAEIDEAVRTLRNAGSGEITLLKCTSAYPAKSEEMNLRTIPHLAEAFGCPVGLSDHTLGIEIPVAAVTMGATVIEKHFTLSRTEGGPDAAFSLEPHEFKAMVQAVRNTEKALGRINYDATVDEQASRVFRRSLFVVQDMKKGDVFTPENIRSIRPGHGLAPKYLDQIIGRCATCDISRGTPMDWNYL